MNTVHTRMTTYFYALAVLALVLAAHVTGLTGPYFRWPSYDIMMHFAGGIGIALFMAGLYRSFCEGRSYRRTIIVVGTFAIGLVWEVFEVYYGLTGYPVGTPPYYLDTLIDIVMALVGALIISFLWMRKLS